MDGYPSVVDISSDDEFGVNKENTDYFEWLSKLLDEDDDGEKGGDDSDDVVVVGEVLAKPNRKRKLPSSYGDGHVDDDDDCVVLEGDPNKKSDEAKDWDDGSYDLVIVGEKGQVACRDYPHSRNQCAKFPFKSMPHSSFCDLCHCYVCDSPAPCNRWGTGDSDADHCHATDKVEFWNRERKKVQMKKNAAAPIPKLTGASLSTVPSLFSRFPPIPFARPNSSVSSAWPMSNPTVSAAPSTGRVPPSPVPPFGSSSTSVSLAPPVCRVPPSPVPPFGSSSTSVSLAPPVCRVQLHPRFSQANNPVTSDGFQNYQAAPPAQSLHSVVPSSQPHQSAQHTSQPLPLTRKYSRSTPTVPVSHPLNRFTSHPSPQLVPGATSTGNFNSSFNLPNIISQSSRRPSFSSVSSGAQSNGSYPHLNSCSNNLVQGERGSSLGPCSATSHLTWKRARVPNRALGQNQSVHIPNNDFSLSYSQPSMNLQQAAKSVGTSTTTPLMLPETTHHESLDLVVCRASSLLGLDQIQTDPSVASQVQQYDPLAAQPSDGLYVDKEINYAVAADWDPLHVSSDLLNNPLHVSFDLLNNPIENRQQVDDFELKEAQVSRTEFFPLHEEQSAYPRIMSPSLGGLMDYCPSSRGFGFDSWILENTSILGEETFLSGINCASTEPASLDVGNIGF
ncbi:hypothetical protein Dimus_016424 [Dionaea muscipula]